MLANASAQPPDTAGTVFIEVLAGSPDGREPPEVAVGRLCQGAPRELRIEVEKPLKTGAIHELAIDPGGGRELLYLTCEVVTRQRSDGGWLLRLMLLNAEGDDLQRWAAHLDALRASAEAC